MKKLLKILGPGLIFASSAIGTSHLVLSTRAGAHHGLTFIWVILIALCLKYPFYRFAPKYVVATGESLIQGYKRQGTWALGIFFFIIIIEMFVVTGAISAVCAGLLSSTLGTSISPTVVFGTLMVATALLLMIGKYKALNSLIKIITVLLILTMGIIFIAVLIKGPIQPIEDFQAESLWEGAGLTLLIGMLGWMPNGMEASTMHSVWMIENEKFTGKKTRLKDALLDFNVGYSMTTILALMFLIIGAYANYGSGNKLEGSTLQFSNQLISLFTDVFGDWSFTVIAIAAFGTIYGTLLTVWDAMTRCFTRCLITFQERAYSAEERSTKLDKWYVLMVPIVGLGGALLFSLFTSQVVVMLEFATIVAFILTPVIALLNWRAITGPEVPKEYRPSKMIHILAGIGLFSMICFALYYGYTLFNNI